MFPPNKCNIQNEKKSIKNRIFDDNIYNYIKILIKSIEEMTQMISNFWIEILSNQNFDKSNNFEIFEINIIMQSVSKMHHIKNKTKVIKKIIDKFKYKYYESAQSSMTTVKSTVTYH